MSSDFSISTSTLNINVLLIFKVLFFVYSRIAPRSCFTCRPSSQSVSAVLDNPLKWGQSERRDQRQGWLRSHACNLICDQHVGPYIKAESSSPTLSSQKMVPPKNYYSSLYGCYFCNRFCGKLTFTRSAVVSDVWCLVLRSTGTRSALLPPSPVFSVPRAVCCGCEARCLMRVGGAALERPALPSEQPFIFPPAADAPTSLQAPGLDEMAVCNFAEKLCFTILYVLKSLEYDLPKLVSALYAGQFSESFHTRLLCTCSCEGIWLF